MPTDPGPHDLDTTGLVLGPDRTATAKTVTADFYAELDAEFDGFAGHLLFARHSFSNAWSTWEMHPEGDEFVYLLDGDADFVLWVDGGEQVLRVDRPGTYVVVPRGIWHTVRPRQPSTMLFATPGAGTMNAEAPPDC